MQLFFLFGCRQGRPHRRREKPIESFCIKLAGVTIQIEHRYRYTRWICRDFVLPEGAAPDFTVSATDEEIEAELSCEPQAAASYCESLCVCRKICHKMPYYNAFLMHAAVVAVDGAAYIFTAPSGTGKSTHIQLWKDHFGDRAVIVNGDKPLIRVIDGAVYVCGTPWRGKEGWGGNYTLPVAGICVIEQSPENHIRKLSVSEASRHIFKQVLISRDSEESFDRFWSLLNRMMTTVDIYLLQCNRDPEASRLSYLTMRRKQNAENQKGISAAPSGR